MASIKKSELQEIGLINDGDILDIVTTAGVNRKIKFSAIKDAVNNSIANYIDVRSKNGTNANPITVIVRAIIL